MELKKISRSKSFEMVNGYGLKSWEKFQLEGDLAEQENPLEAYVELGKIIDEAFKEAHPKSTEPMPQEIQVDKPTKTMIEEMEDCGTYADIQSFRFTVKNDAEKAVYERKLEELSPKNQ